MLALALAGARARAEGPKSDVVGVLPIVVDGDMPASWRAQLDGRLREGFERGAHALVTADAPTKCDDAACIRDIGRESGARWIARARVTVRDRDFDVTIELLD